MNPSILKTNKSAATTLNLTKTNLNKQNEEEKKNHFNDESDRIDIK